MKACFVIGGFVAAMLLASCATAQPTPAPLPTMTNTAAPPTAAITVPTLPTATSTPVPPTATAVPTATATATQPPTLTPTPPAFLLTQDLAPIPAGMGALIIVNHYSQELDLDLGGKLYKIPGSNRMVIFLSPGRYNFSATIPGFAGKTGTTEVVESYYRTQEYGQ